MDELLVILILSSFILIHHAIKGSGFSIIKIFNYSWLIMYIVYFIGIYEYYPISFEINICSAIFVTTVNVFFMLFKSKMPNVIDIDKERLCLELGQTQISFKKILFLSILCWVFSFNRMINSLIIIASEGMEALRANVYFGEIYSTIEKLAYQYFIQPFFLVTIIIAVQSFVLLRNKSNFKVIIIAIINAFIYSILFGGRSLLIITLIYTAILFLINNKGDLFQLIKNQKRELVYFGIIASGIAIYSTLRMSRNWTVFEEFGVYLTGGLSYLSQIVDANILDEGVLGGRGIIGGLYDFIGLTLLVFGYKIELVSQIYSRYTMEFLPIGSDIITNFTATSMATFLLDFGRLGLIIGGALYAFLFAKVERNFISNNNIFNLAVYIYFCNIALESIQNYTLKSVVPIFVITYLYLFLHKKNG